MGFLKETFLGYLYIDDHDIFEQEIAATCYMWLCLSFLIGAKNDGFFIVSGLCLEGSPQTFRGFLLTRLDSPQNVEAMPGYATRDCQT